MTDDADEAATDPAFGRLLDKLAEEHNFDFREYKTVSLARRIRARLHRVHVDSFESYLTYLDRHADEHVALFNTILINVTGFLRDAEAWKALAADVLPRLVEDAAASGSLRIWSAGCSSGEEAYTLAMLVAEELGDRAADVNVKIYATDVDDDALQTARHGLYRLDDLRDVPPALLETYFSREGQAYRVRRDVRRWCIFGHHNVAQDPPMSHVDLLVCRNVLIYVTSELQERILTRFHYAVRERGFLFLGRSESLLARSRWFTAFAPKARIFERTTVPAPTVAVVAQRASSANPGHVDTGRATEVTPAIAPTIARLQRLLEALPAAIVFIDAADKVLVWNPAAESLFDIPTETALGRQFRDLDISYRAEGLRARIEDVKTSHIPARLDNVTFSRRSGETVHADFAVIPVVEGMRVTAVAVYGIDGTESARVKEGMARLTEQHATAIQELQSTNEELETTNEELQSTNEELETTNEELQSTNEELETTVQELQAANDQLGALNVELDRRRGAAREADEHQRAVLGSLPWPVVVLDRNGVVRTWNRAAEEIWGLEAGHVLQRPFWSVPVGDVAQKIRETLARVTMTGVAEMVTKIDFTLPSSEARHLTMQVTPLRNEAGELTGVVGVVTGNDPRA